jgi:hypothetical protein
MYLLERQRAWEAEQTKERERREDRRDTRQNIALTIGGIAILLGPVSAVLLNRYCLPAQVPPVVNVQPPAVSVLVESPSHPANRTTTAATTQTSQPRAATQTKDLPPKKPE